MKKLFAFIVVTSLLIPASALVAAQEKPAHASKTSAKKSTAKADTGDAQKTSAAAAGAADKSTASKDPLENMKFRNLGPAGGGRRAPPGCGGPPEPQHHF